MSELWEEASNSPEHDSAEALPAAETEKKRTRRRKAPVEGETTEPVAKRTRRRKPNAEEQLAPEAAALAPVTDEQPAQEEGIARTEEPAAVQETVVVSEHVSDHVTANDVTEVESEPVAESVSEVVEEVPAAEEEKPAITPPKRASVEPSKRRRIEETERRQRRAEDEQRTPRTDLDGDRPFRIEPISVRGPRAERDTVRRERAQAVREPTAPIIPSDAKVFVPSSADASTESPLHSLPLSARLLKAQELFAGRQSDAPAAPMTSLVSPAKPVIVTEADPPAEGSPVPSDETPAAAPTSRLPSPIWHKGLTRKARSKKSAAARKKAVAASTRPVRRRNATKPYSPLLKRLVKEASGRTAGRRRRSGR